MKFFNRSDLEYYSSVRSQTYPKGDKLTTIGNSLKDGAFGKTWYWADRLKEEGYNVKHSGHWQISGKIRKYAWSKVFLPGYEDSQVYFTVGVGSRLNDDVFSLEFKLDCHRATLTKDQVKLFDEHLIKDDKAYPRVLINVEKLNEYSWENLLEETLVFIEGQEEYYRDCANLIWPNGYGNEPMSKDLIDSAIQFREGHKSTKKGPIKANQTKRQYSKELLHEEIKERIYCQLKKQFDQADQEVKIGTEILTKFGKLIDLVTSDPKKGYTFYEIKTGSNTLACIREAIGQILEYCYYPKVKHASKLIIVAPHLPTNSDEQYLTHLRSQLDIELYYQFYDRVVGVLRPELF